MLHRSKHEAFQSTGLARLTEFLENRLRLAAYWPHLFFTRRRMPSKRPDQNKSPWAASDLSEPADVLTIAQIDAQVAPSVNAVLGPRGFVHVKPLHWLRSADAPLRQMFVYRQFKGAAIAPQWGFSLDFVPHLAARKLAWHRTEKSALFDLSIDGQGRGLDMSYLWGVPRLVEYLPVRVAQACEAATLFWQRGQTLEQVFLLIDELRAAARPDSRSQLALAAALSLAARGRVAEGRSELEACLARHELGEKTRADFWRAFNLALERSVRGP
jgi:hypothetical protein